MSANLSHYEPGFDLPGVDLPGVDLPGAELPNLDLPAPLPEHIGRFQELYQRHIGVELSSEQALEELIHLLTIVKYRQADKHRRANALYQLRPPQQ